ncbi:aldose epimerase family protein [Maridesulfovibrio sp.]|uniref:aldose epimerase family protein n=1 Tax=unclassified Maridesulfovibrio TaxID=2794999 RepID=UPI003AFF9982
MGISRKTWGYFPAGADFPEREIQLFTLENSAGYRARISNYGATLTGLEVPVGSQMVDVVLGFDYLREYIDDSNYMGASIGRVAGRISGATFTLDGQEFILDANEGNSHLHGGNTGFHNQIWEIAAIRPYEENPSITLSLHSPHGSGGYPGNLHVQATFTLLGTDLNISYRAECDKPTPLNITSHPYFNLAGAGSPIDNHELNIFSTESIKLDNSLLPNGEIINTAGTKSDFSNFVLIGKNAQDRFFILENDQEKLVPAAVARCNESGLELEVRTNQRGVQLYTADGVINGIHGKNGLEYGSRCGFCIEPMGYPDAVNRQEFPSVILNPGEKYYHSTEYRFRNYTAAPENN